MRAGVAEQRQHHLLNETLSAMAAPNTVAVPYIFELTAFLLAVVVVVPICRRFKISPVLGYLALGAGIGPYGLGLIYEGERVQHLAELGVVFLMFTIGLELSFARLAKYSKLIFGFGLAQVLVSAAAIGAVAYLWDNQLEAAIVIGLCLSLSSTAMVMQLLGERGRSLPATAARRLRCCYSRIWPWCRF